ncbi:MAG: flagellar type III secretion system pore protein FliP [Firmicutes bacterium]|nr:flagellar type III secretion system pore protein FliP [Bacillota bacterium]
MSRRGRTLVVLAVVIASVLVVSRGAGAAPQIPIPKISIDVGTADKPQEVSGALKILLLLTVLSLAPAILILMTSFTRIMVVLSFVRNALATQQMPPNQVLIGLALFLTFFVMSPVWNQVNDNALQPYLAGEIAQDRAMELALKPVREFMLKQTREKDLELFIGLGGFPRPNTPDDVPTYAIVPAFCLSELKTAFQIGFMVFVPFLVIDMVVAATLMSMGMLMLPPMMISLPFKILLFVLVDGWHLITKSLLLSFK